MKYAEIIVNVPLKQNFTYSFDDEYVIPGIRVIVSFGRRNITGFVIKVMDNFNNTEGYKIKKIQRIVDTSPVFIKKQVELALWMEKFYLCSRGEALSTMIPYGKVDKGLPPLDFDDIENSNLELTTYQKEAIESITKGNEKLYYLFGVTGSGKTEVYLECAERIIKNGKQVIYLVPEITLTHQLIQQVQERFAKKVAILHSGLTPSQRINQCRKIIKGEVSLIIGARSAVFAPTNNLGLIIIDEEHETSYKSGNSPRYHARQIAQVRIAKEGGKLLMGSATPSLESWYLMKEKLITRLDLPERVSGGFLPSINIVDMKTQKEMFSERLIYEMNKTLKAGKQVILFLNRRGFSYFFHCNDCGYEIKCPHCDIALTYHKSSNGLVCHYCGYRKPIVSVCPECGSLDVIHSGFGTEMVEAEVKRLFPSAVVARLDTDIAKKKGISATIIDDFRNGKIQILLGTQMVAKGLNFPNAELVGIVLADSGLNIPDFRAQERTFDLLVQVSGRAGRYSKNGKVIIQTYHPTNQAIIRAAKMNIEQFYTEELEIRKETGFPPFSRLVNVVLRGKIKEAVEKEINSIVDILRNNKKKYSGEIEIFGANECPIEKIANNWRFQIIVRSKNPNLLHYFLKNEIGNYHCPSGMNLEIDFDPVMIM